MSAQTLDDLDYPICVTCGTQVEPVSANGAPPKSCKICDDPRQFVPSTGQAWTTLREVRKNHKNKWWQDSVDSNLWFANTQPKFGIGQRCCFIQTPHGNILWDLITLVDDETVEFINSRGGLKAIIISHPHYYTAYATWSKTFNCPVYVSKNDTEWFSRAPDSPATGGQVIYLEDVADPTPPSSPTLPFQAVTKEILPNVTAIVAGGHFPGSLLLHHAPNKLFIADTIVTVPSAYLPPEQRTHTVARTRQTTYAFLWSIPNMIQLPPREILRVWCALAPFAFDVTHGAFEGMDIRDPALKARMLWSMQAVARTAGCGEEHPLLGLRLE